MAITRHIKAKCFTTIPIRLELFNKDNEPLDLSNCEFVFTARETVESEVVIEYSSASGDIIELAPGVIEITIAASKVTKPKVLLYDIFLFQPNFQRCLVEGTLTLEPSLTQKVK